MPAFSCVATFGRSPWGSSDTGKTFPVQAMDFTLGAGSKLKDVPERAGYDRIPAWHHNRRGQGLSPDVSS